MDVKTLVVLATLALAGCPTEDDTDGADTDGAGDTDAQDLCAPQDPSTNTVSETQVNTAYPSAAGGTIADGTYDLVRFEVYAPATADDHVRARRFVISGDTIVSIEVDDGVADPIQGGTFTTSGTNISFAISCPQEGAVTLPYTVSGDELWLFDPSEPNVQVYALQ
jgi:hypothetical protein